MPKSIGIPNFEPGDQVNVLLPLSGMSGIRFRIVRPTGPCSMKVFGEALNFAKSYQVEMLPEELEFIKKEVPGFVLPDKDIIFPAEFLFYAKPKILDFYDDLENTRMISCPEQFIQDISDVDRDSANTLSKILTMKESK